MKTDAQIAYQVANENKDYFECQLPTIAETEKAICFDADHSHIANQHRGVWIPKSQMIVVDGRADGFGFRYFIKNWLYKKLN